MDATIGVLLFDDYPHLAKRCLGSLQRVFPAEFCRRHLRVGGNAIAASSKAYLDQLLADGVLSPENVFLSETNSYKYPMMRRMFETVTTEYVIWFDDDSYLLPTASAEWPERLAEAMAGVAMCGRAYTIFWQGKQRGWVKKQPWYGGADPAKRPVIHFLTGGWWCLRTDVMRRLDYPFPELRHRGGDTMLGEALRQQKLPTRQWFEHVAINTEKRRGFDEGPLGSAG